MMVCEFISKDLIFFISKNKIVTKLRIYLLKIEGKISSNFVYVFLYPFKEEKASKFTILVLPSRKRRANF